MQTPAGGLLGTAPRPVVAGLILFGLAFALAHPGRTDAVPGTDGPTEPNCDQGVAAPNNPCSPGGGPKLTDCNMEWLLNPPRPPVAGFPAHRTVCYEGDPRCDFDPDLENRSCTFQTRICVNNDDARLPTCLRQEIYSLTILSPPSNSTAPDNLTNLDSIRAAALGDFGFDNIQTTRHHQVLSGPTPFGIPNRCSNLIPLQVALHLTASGRRRSATRTIKLMATTSIGTRDTDSLTLVCRPSTCGDGKIQIDHEQCDDGNRLNGDGCDQACQIEEPTPTQTRTFTRTPTPTDSPTPSLTPSLTATPSETPTETFTFIPTDTPTDTPTETPTSTPSLTPTETLMPGPPNKTNTPTPTRTPTQTSTPT